MATVATPIRKKRNFKALQLEVKQAASPTEQEPVPTRLAPAPAGVPAGKKRPPPMTLKAPKIPINGTTNGATLDGDRQLISANGLSTAPVTASASARRNTIHDTLSNTLANLDINSETKRFDIRNEDLKDLQELGQGNGGSVKKVEHIPTGTLMAKKVRLCHTSLRNNHNHSILTNGGINTECPY
jgi:mitogen-activated protein kinase kinase